MDMNLILLFVIAFVMALAFGLLGWLKSYLESGQKFDLTTFLATLLYSIIVGVIGVQTGLIKLETLADWQTIFSAMWLQYAMIYTGLVYVIGKIIGMLAIPVASKTTFYPRAVNVDPARKMDQETRKWLVSDQPEVLKQPVLRAVDQAEAATTYRYAIEAGAWIYLVEFGEVTGAKHYYFRGWFGTGVIAWKPITSECLESIRKTGKFPDYDKLY